MKERLKLPCFRTYRSFRVFRQALHADMIELEESFMQLRPASILALLALFVQVVLGALPAVDFCMSCRIVADAGSCKVESAQKCCCECSKQTCCSVAPAGSPRGCDQCIWLQSPDRHSTAGSKLTINRPADHQIATLPAPAPTLARPSLVSLEPPRIRAWESPPHLAHIRTVHLNV